MTESKRLLLASHLVAKGVDLHVIEDILDWIENNDKKEDRS